MFYTYVIQSQKDHYLYFGYTADLRRRFKDHNEGKVSSTQFRRPFRLIYYEAYISKIDALTREKQLKHYAKAWVQLKRRIPRCIVKTI